MSIQLMGVLCMATKIICTSSTYLLIFNSLDTVFIAVLCLSPSAVIGYLMYTFSCKLNS